ncbi:signal peptidase II [Aliagarivorans marinus]|uniref:signal peptidase II n=1 Tax=Aliagarivorans marinus TaxID=561965 RepID=UPI00040DBA82|nr:signal peptidase II [Aliagarivorans marinus]
MHNKQEASSSLIWLWLSAALFVLDQATKWIVVENFALYERKAITSFFNLVYVRNYGAAFSFLGDAGGWQRWLFTGIALVVSALLVWWLSKTPRQQTALGVGYALILSGALGNVLDRMMFGYVVDFLDFYWGSYHWPAFNVADSAICVGAGLLIVDALFLEKRRKDEDRAGQHG